MSTILSASSMQLLLVHVVSLFTLSLEGLNFSSKWPVKDSIVMSSTVIIVTSFYITHRIPKFLHIFITRQGAEFSKLILNILVYNRSTTSIYENSRRTCNSHTCALLLVYHMRPRYDTKIFACSTETTPYSSNVAFWPCYHLLDKIVSKSKLSV